MKTQSVRLGWSLWVQRWFGALRTRMFNLNDPRWGRGDNHGTEGGTSGDPEGADASAQKPPERPPLPSSQGPSHAGPPDLDELWRDFNRKLGGIFGGGSGNRDNGNGPGGAGRPGGGSGGGGFQPDMKSASMGIGLILGVVFLIWMGTGFFIVQEGEQAVVTQFGRYNRTVNAGFNWRLPYPIQRHELVFVTQIRSVDIGQDAILKATGLKESAMLTQDENILDIKFAVQYRLSDARAYLFESKNPQDAVVQAAETAIREVIGRMRMDAALSEERDQIAPQVRTLMQTILDRYNVGIEVVGINLQQGGVRPPEQVQASFDDVLKAGQERERAKNEAQAYANDVIPRAVGSASRLKEEADAYKARVVAQAQGDAQRFRSVLTEYQKAPQVTRDRMYLDTMQQIYSNVTKVVVDSHQGSNLLYLPLDKLLQATAGPSATPGVTVPAADATGAAAASGAQLPGAANNSQSTDPRARDSGRSRDRESR